MSDELTRPEASRRHQLEQTIRTDAMGFVRCGTALAEIRDSKLYRSTHKTFEAYCKDVWGWTKQRAYQLMDAAGVVKDLPKKSQPRLTSERQARALLDVPKEKREEVLASSRGEPTARKITETAKNIAVPDIEIRDKVGRVIPESLKQDWLKATSVGQDIRDAGRKWKATVDWHLEQGDKYKRKHNLTEAMSKDIGQLVYELSCAIPHAICPFCKGEGKKCEKCHSRGWVSKHYWTSFVPEKLKGEKPAAISK